ncbi:MAG: hypothetical protein IJ519_02085 [Clostridia bacterium]|nr:hypothetical protein [Clostridia bacterium]
MGKILRNVGVISFGIITNIFIIIFPLFCLIFELEMIYNSPDVWGVAYFFIALNLYFIAIEYFFLVGSAVFTKNNIYRLSKFLIFKKYSYDDVIGYVMKKDSGVIYRRGGPRKVITFDVEIYFSDDTLAEFSTKDEHDSKILYIKNLLEEHHCHRNGRIKKSKRNKLNLYH